MPSTTKVGGEKAGVASLQAALTALASAGAMALGAAAQQNATQHAPYGRGSRLRFIAALVRSRLWLAGVFVVLLSFGLYLLALVLGPLILVQPIMVTGVVWGSLFAAWLVRRRPDRWLLVGGAVCGIGLALFLGTARPGPGLPGQGVGSVVQPGALWLLVGLGVLLATALVTAIGSTGLLSGLGLALAVGILFGINAALTKIVADQFAMGWLEPFRHWAFYASLGVGPAGFLLSQRAMQAAQLLTPVNAIISTADPMVAAAAGLALLGEQIVSTPIALALESLGAVITAVGIVVVARRTAWLIEARQREHIEGYRVGWG